MSKPLSEDRPCTRCGKTPLEVDFRYLKSEYRSSWCRACEIASSRERRGISGSITCYCSNCGQQGHKITTCKEPHKVGLKFCIYCKRFLPRKSFSKISSQSDLLSSYCNVCNSKVSSTSARNKRGASWEGAIKSLVRWSKASARRKNLEFNISFSYVMSLLKQQDYRCYYTGRPLTIDIYSRKAGSTVSIDRTDSTKGYIEGNIALTTYKLNRMKSDCSPEEFIQLCRDVVNYRLNNHRDSQLDVATPPPPTP